MSLREHLRCCRRYGGGDAGAPPEVSSTLLGKKARYAPDRAFDTVQDGLGKWLVTLAAWLFAISTMISWSYYGEQGVVFLAGERAVVPYRIVYCLLIAVATLGFIRTDAELNNFTNLGTGLMLWANIPLMLIFGSLAMKAYHEYGKKLKSGEFDNEKK